MQIPNPLFSLLDTVFVLLCVPVFWVCSTTVGSWVSSSTASCIGLSLRTFAVRRSIRLQLPPFYRFVVSAQHPTAIRLHLSNRPYCYGLEKGSFASDSAVGFVCKHCS